MSASAMGASYHAGRQSVVALAESSVYGAKPSNITTDRLSIPQQSYFGVPTSFVTKTPPWRHSVDNKIFDLLDLAEGWDGEFAYPIMPEAVYNSRKLAYIIGRYYPDLPHPTITPTIDGKVVLEWYTTSHSISFIVGRTIDIFYRDEAVEIEWEGPLDLSPVHPGAFLREHYW